MNSIFSRLTGQRNTNVLSILQKLFVFLADPQDNNMAPNNANGLASFDQHIQQYEEVFYGKKEKHVELLASSARLNHLKIRRPSLPFEVIINASEALVIAIGTLHEIALKVEHQLASRAHLCDEATRARRTALGAIQELKLQLLCEAAVLQADLASRLQLWYQGQSKLEFVRSRRFAHENDEQSECFINICASINKLEKTVTPYKQRLYQKRVNKKPPPHLLKSVYQNLNAEIIDLQTKAHVALSSVSFVPLETVNHAQGGSVSDDAFSRRSPIKLTFQQLAKIDQDHRSFWKSVQYRAKLQVLDWNHQRNTQVNGSDYHTRWVVNTQAQALIQMNLSQLNWLFHRKTRKSYQSYNRELKREQCDLARKLLKNSLLSMDGSSVGSQHNENDPKNQNIQLWLAVLPDVNLAWQHLMRVCQTPECCGEERFEAAIQSICVVLNLSAQEQSTLRLRLIEQFVQPAVDSTLHPAYPLLYKYHAKAAHAVLKPRLSDILDYLRDDSAWALPEIASQHLSFLLSGKFSWNWQLVLKTDLLSQFCLNEMLFGEWIPVNVWKRLIIFMDHHTLLTDLRQCSLDVAYWCEGSDRESFADAILAKLSISSVQSLRCDDWMARVSALARLLEHLNSILTQPAHSQEAAAQNLLLQITERLVALAQDIHVFRIPSFKQLLVYCYNQRALQNSSCKAQIESTIKSWTAPSEAPTQPTARTARIETDVQTNVDVTVFKKLKLAVEHVIHVVTELSRFPLQHVYQKGLPCTLTRVELNTLASIDFTQFSDHSAAVSLQKSLMTLSGSPFVDQILQRQSNHLLIILQSENADARSASVEYYCQLQSHRSRSGPGFFTASTANDSGALVESFSPGSLPPTHVNQQ